MGVVYRAEDTLLGRKVAIKFPSAAAGLGGRLLSEARAASSLNHPHIATVHDCGEYDGRPYIVMELVEGKGLEDFLRNGALSAQRSVEIAAEIAEALAEAHSHHLIHRDIKPSNVRINSRGEVKVVDFGLAKELSPAGLRGSVTVTAEGLVSGTPRYMSPEQARGAPANERSDLFSLGTLLYECLTGQPAFDGANAIEVMAQVLHVDPAPPSKVNPLVPAELDRVVFKALEKQPVHRYASAQELLDDLRCVQKQLAQSNSRPTESIVIPFPAQGSRPARPHWWTRAAVAIVVCGTAAIAVWSLWPRGPHQPSPEATRWYQEGVNALRDGTALKASQALERAASLDGRFTMANVRLAEAWFELDYSDRAREALLRALGPESDAGRLARADSLYLQSVRSTLTGEFAAAAARQSEIVGLMPEERKPPAYVDLGRALEKSEKPRDAIAAYREAIRRSPQYAAANLRLGVLYGRRQELVPAEEAFRQAESLYRSSSNIEGVVEVLYQRGVMLIKSGKAAQADALLERAYAMARTAETAHQQVGILLQLADIAIARGDLADAEKHATQAIELAREANLENLTTRGMINLGNSYFAAGNSAAAEKYFAQALENARRSKARNGEARALLSLGSLRIQEKRGEQGVRDVEQALAFYRSGEYTRETGQALILLGRARRDRGEYDEAARVFSEQLALARKSANAEQVSLALDGAGSVALHRERYPEALAQFREQAEICRRAGNRVGAGYALLRVAEASARLGRTAEARELHREALQTVAGLGVAQSISMMERELEIDIAMFERRYGAAREALLKLLSMPGLDSGTEADLKTDLCLALSHSGPKAEARRVCGEALELTKRTGHFRLIEKALRYASEGYLETGDPAAAKRTAEEAVAHAAQSGTRESEWQSHLLAARAARAMHNASSSADHAAQARASLSAWQNNWSAEDIRTYYARPDVTDCRRLLEQLSGGANARAKERGEN